jgi:hypothetical protein
MSRLVGRQLPLCGSPPKKTQTVDFMSFLTQGFGQLAPIAILCIEVMTEAGKIGPTKTPALCEFVVKRGVAKV